MWDSIQVVHGTDDNVVKLVFTQHDAVAESVLYKYPTYEDRTVVCCSTQSGCPVGCRFCGSGDYFVRSLSTTEIVEQVVACVRHTAIDITKSKKFQIMFMSMGEPMLNIKNLNAAIVALHALYSNADLLVSTTAPMVDYTEFTELSCLIPKIGLQFSVHETTDEARNTLIPFKRKLPLRMISELGTEWCLATKRKPFFNYCAHGDNTTLEDVARIEALFPPDTWNATISVICERDESVKAANERQVSLASNFSSKLVELGYNVRVFNPAGQDDIGGGCGQLWYVQEWMHNNPERAKPSVGNRLVKVHTPVMW